MVCLNYPFLNITSNYPKDVLFPSLCPFPPPRKIASYCPGKGRVPEKEFTLKDKHFERNCVLSFLPHYMFGEFELEIGED